MGLLKPFQNAIGIDISDQVIRMVQIVPKGKLFKLNSISARPIQAGVIVDGEIKNPKIITEILKDLVKRPNLKHPTTNAAILSLTEKKTFTKILDLPNSTPEKFEAILREGLAEHIPISLDEAYIDWQFCRKPNVNEKTIRVLVSVAPQLLVESYLEVSKNAGLIPIILEPESAALSRFALFESNISGSHMIIDLGATRTGMIITEEDFVAYSSALTISGDQLTNALQIKLGLSPQEAEQAKRICGLDPKKGKGAVKKILEPELRPLIQKTTEIISYFEEHSTKNIKIQDITLVGGGAKLSKLDELMQSMVSLPVKIGHWPNNCSIPNIKLQTMGPSFATAFGLALRGAQNLPWFTDKNL
ncbi:MAG: type IV pilus assembly protein PilM [Patescibacteria group bacterium]|jgi:type IV pilus assembly protein PilM